MKRLFLLPCVLISLVAQARLVNIYRSDGTVSQYQRVEIDSIGFGGTVTPSAVDLRQSPCLPNIMQQGYVGCCSSAAITYMMYGNAYARYMQHLYPENNFHPSTGSESMQFSPKFTYNLGGKGTAWVLETIKEQGVPPRMYSDFNNWPSWPLDDDVAKSWSATPGVWDMAQNFRLNHYEQIWLSRFNYQMTTSAGGRQLLERIKELLRAGNLVMTGGYSNYWCTDTVRISNIGQLGRTGELVIPYCVDNGEDVGGHQVCIVGYDDEITCVKNGVTLKGAFLIANSWGAWGNHGYMWVMYDALNGTSEYAALNVAGRVYAMDQVVLFDWRTDLQLGYPEQTVALNMMVADRESLQIELFRFDKQTRESVFYTPYVVRDAGRHPYVENHLNFDGATGKSSGELVFNYDSLMSSLPAGKSKNDYIWGVKVRNNEAQTITVQSVLGQDANHHVFHNSQLRTEIAPGRTVLFALCVDGIYDKYSVVDGLLNVEVDVQSFSILPYYGVVENYSGSTFFIAGINSNNNASMFAQLRSGEYLMRMVVQDESARKRYTVSQYVFSNPGLEFYQESFLRLSVCNYGIVPVNGHRYTLQLDLYASGNLVFHGVSATGAFDRFNDAFVANGPIVPVPIPYSCVVEDY